MYRGSAALPYRWLKEKQRNVTEIKLLPKQDDFTFSEAKYPAFIAGWGTGKSMCALFRALLFAQETPGNLGLICRREYTDLRDSTIKDFERYTGLKVNEQTKEVKLGNGSVIMFRHAEELDTLKNINLGFFFLEQAEELPTSEQFFFLCGRLRREGRRRSGWITANAAGHNWCHELWIEKQDPEFPCFQMTTLENEKNLPADYIESLKKLPERIYRQYVLNDHTVAEGLIWPEFSEEKHTCLSFDIPDAWKETIGLDHGHEHPTAILFGACDYDGRLIIYNEHYESGQLISYHASRLREIEPRWAEMRRMIDPTCKFKTMQDGSRVYSIIEAYLDYGIHFSPAPMETLPGIDKVAQLFKEDKVVIFKDKCPNLLREIKDWRWKKARLGDEKRVKEEPVRLNDDACKALIYLVSGRPEAAPRIKDEPERWTEKTFEHYEQTQYQDELEEAGVGD